MEILEKLSAEKAKELNLIEIKKAAMVVRSVNHKMRAQIIRFLEAKGCGQSVTEIFIHLRVEQSVASQHLGILRRSGVVNTHRNGKNIYYSLNAKRLNAVINCAEMLNHDSKQK